MTAPARGGPRPELLLGVLLFVGLVPLLAFGPRAFPVAPGVVSAAAAEGYSTAAAYAIAAGWLLLAVLASAILSLRGRAPMPAGSIAAPPGGVAGGRTLWFGAAAVFLLVVLVYLPPFLAAGGPFIEDQIHLTALHRMLGGLRPYTDFEFLYGPLMLYPAWLWTVLFGYSPLSFYSYVALLEGFQYAALFAIVWLLIPDRRWRLVALVVLGGLLFNALVGPNWSASRRLLGLLGILVVAHAPLRPSAIAAAGVLFGLQLAYSHDIGVASLAAAGAIYALLLSRPGRLRTALSGFTVAATAVIVWYATALLLLGSSFGDYLAEAADLTARFGAGEAGLRFYWTLNSLALFATLILAGIVIGGGLVRGRRVAPERADLLFIGGFAFALVTLKSGLNRADFWHLDVVIVPLALALLVPGGRRFQLGIRGRVLAATLLGIVSFTYLFGAMPSASFFAAGWLRGARIVLGSPPATASPPSTRAPMIGPGRTDSASTAHRLAVLLNGEEWRDRPVLFYSDTWALPRLIGVFKTDPINDDFLYSEERGFRARRFLEDRPDALVLMSRDVHDRLYGLTAPDSFPEHLRRFRPTLAKQMASWLSTTHYRGLPTEVRLKDERWRRAVGDHVRTHYRLATQVGRIMILAPIADTRPNSDR